jgi:cupin fold WbuC family metalloprotein
MSLSAFVETAPGVFETIQDPIVVSDEQVASVVRASKSAPRGRARLLLHGHRSDNLHEMVIAIPPDSCDHPHINFKSGKSFLALSGQFAVLCFSDDGVEIRSVVLSADDRWRGGRIVRLGGPTWHTIIPLEGDTVFLETIVGPFEGNRFAPWFPNAESVRRTEWVRRLRQVARTECNCQYPSPLLGERL